MEFGTHPTGWYIEGDLPNLVAVSTGSTVLHLALLELPSMGRHVHDCQ